MSKPIVAIVGRPNVGKSIQSAERKVLILIIMLWNRNFLRHGDIETVNFELVSEI